MTPKDTPLNGFFRRCRKWSAGMAALQKGPDRLNYMRDRLPELLLDRPMVDAVVERIAAGDPALRPSQGGLFENEMLLYLDPRRLFSIRIYFHEAGQYTPIHDHSAWGISGTPFGALGVIGYRRTDDGTEAARARLEKTRERALAPGELDVVHPLDNGIHQTGSPGEKINVMISAYGAPVRRLYIRSFDPESGRITKHFPPKIRRKHLAREAAALFAANPLPPSPEDRRNSP